MLPSPADYCTAYTWPKKAGIFQTGGGDSRWGSLAFPGPWKGIFFCPPVSGCSHLFIGVFNAPRLAVEVPTLLKKGATPCPAPHSTVFPLLFPFRRQMSRRSARLPPKTRGAQPGKGQGSLSTPLQFMEGRLEASGHAALPRSLLYCIDLVVRKGFLFYTVLAGFYIHQPVATHMGRHRLRDIPQP
jgi:hypothetical protein